QLALGAAGVADGVALVIEALEDQAATLDCDTADPLDPATCAGLAAQLEQLGELLDGATGVAGGTAQLAGTPASGGNPPSGLHALAAGIDEIVGDAAQGTGAAGLAAGARGLADGASAL